MCLRCHQVNLVAPQAHRHIGISGNLDMSENSAKVREKAQSQGKIRKRSWNLCSQENWIMAAQRNNLCGDELT